MVSACSSDHEEPPDNSKANHHPRCPQWAPSALLSTITVNPGAYADKLHTVWACSQIDSIAINAS